MPWLLLLSIPNHHSINGLPKSAAKHRLWAQDVVDMNINSLLHNRPCLVTHQHWISASLTMHQFKNLAGNKASKLDSNDPMSLHQMARKLKIKDARFHVSQGVAWLTHCTIRLWFGLVTSQSSRMSHELVSKLCLLSLRDCGRSETIQKMLVSRNLISQITRSGPGRSGITWVGRAIVGGMPQRKGTGFQDEGMWRPSSSTKEEGQEGQDQRWSILANMHQDCWIERESQRNIKSRIVTSSTIVTDQFRCDPTHFAQGLQNPGQILRNHVPGLQQQKHRMCGHGPRNDEGSQRFRWHILL